MSDQSCVNFWGLTPTLDLHELKVQTSKGYPTVFDDVSRTQLLEYYAEKLGSSKECSRKNEVSNYLIIGAGDGRHVLKTIARAYRHPEKALNIFVVERSSEIMARQLLLMSLFCDKAEKHRILEKADVFLEIYGNTYVRPSTYEFIKSKSVKLLRYLNSDAKLSEEFPFLSLIYLKQKEIDNMAHSLMLWKGENKFFDFGKEWNLRLRSYLGPRYDNRMALYDWDYNMKLVDCAVIGFQKYSTWRETGVAFKIREGRFTYPNKTLCSTNCKEIEKLGLRDSNVQHYIGNITSSPYIAFGIECENKDYLKKEGDKYVKTSEEISKYNISDLMYELNLYSDYQPLQDRVNIYFLSLDTLFQRMVTKDEFKDYFDCIYLAYDMQHCILESLANVLKQDALFVTETAKFVLDWRSDKKVQHFEEVVSKVRTLLSLQLVETCDPSKNAYGKFMFINDKLRS